MTRTMQFTAASILALICLSIGVNKLITTFNISLKDGKSKHLQTKITTANNNNSDNNINHHNEDRTIDTTDNAVVDEDDNNDIIIANSTDTIIKFVWGEGSPLVNEEYKFVFFFVPKVACTVWKQLFRRMAGYENWTNSDLVHDYTTNGLQYLASYSLEKVTHMMNSPEWTKAMLIRDPKERLLSAYLNKGKGEEKYIRNICHKISIKEWKKQNNRTKLEWNNALKREHGRKVDNCTNMSRSSLRGFFSSVVQGQPNNPHWIPQSHRIDKKYWKWLSSISNSNNDNNFNNNNNNNFSNNNNNNNNNKNNDSSKDENHILIGHMANKEQFAKTILKRIGAWDRYGGSGWGKYGNESFLGGQPSVSHKTDAKSKLRYHYGISPGLEDDVEDFYYDDYELSIFNFTRNQIIHD